MSPAPAAGGAAGDGGRRGVHVARGLGVAKSWPGGHGLAPLDFDVGSGELVALRGRSGSGKSTLLALLAGWCEPSAGTLVRSAGDAAGPWHATSIVPQALGLIPELTVDENVALVVRLATRRRAPGDVRVADLLDGLDLTDLRARRPSEISLGQQQRTAVARAIAVPARLVLVDEPTSHQDRHHADAVMARLRAAATGGAAVLVASHDPIAIDASDRVIDLDARPV